MVSISNTLGKSICWVFQYHNCGKKGVFIGSLFLKSAWWVPMTQG